MIIGLGAEKKGISIDESICGCFSNAPPIRHTRYRANFSEDFSIYNVAKDLEHKLSSVAKKEKRRLRKDWG